MLGLEEVTAWTAVGLSAFVALTVALAVRAARRSHRTAESLLWGVIESASRSEELLSELKADLDRVRPEPEAQDERSRTNDEARPVRLLSRLGSAPDLDAAATCALEDVTEELGSDGAAVLIFGAAEERFSASFGLSASESHRELIGMPAGLNEAQAVTIRYRYSPEEEENDAFRLTAGLAVPLQVEERHIGTLAVFWRRTAHDPAEAEITRLEGMSELIGPPLEKARRFEEIRRLTDLDPVARLPNDRYFGDRLRSEVARARRYERRLSVLGLRLRGNGAPPPSQALLGAIGSRIGSAVRSADVPCYLGGEEFAVILPEAGLDSADLLRGRLELALRSVFVDASGEGIAFQAAASELDPDDNPDSLMQRALAGLGSSDARAAGTHRPVH
jgi:GGDEF domain-containing protein